jgi:hypothetical protein
MMGNERRYYYDYYMLCCGPIPLAERVADGDAAVAAFTGEGALTAVWQAAASAGATEPAP